MTAKIMEKVEQAYVKKDRPDFRVGDTVSVAIRIVEGQKERTQVFTGTVICRKGKGTNEMFTVRRIVNNEGVERIFPVNSPQVLNVKVVRSGHVRRSFPDISGDRIVWEEERNGKWDVYVYDLTTQTATQITDDPARQGYPAISGDRIVWGEERNGNNDIYVYNMITQTETRITIDASGQHEPAISGDRIVWMDYRDAPAPNIYSATTPPCVPPGP